MSSSGSSSFVLSARGLRKSWSTPQGDIEVLRGVDLDLAKGGSIAIIGPSGSGKSTLLTLLATLDRPTSGSLIIDGLDTGTLTDQQLSRWRGKSLGIVFQQFHLMPSLTALENVSLPLEIQGVKGSEGLAEKALSEVGMTHRLHHLPGALSGGECQRVAIARAIVAKPALLLADEPSGSLDPDTGEQVTHLLFDMVQNRSMSMILVTHNVELARRCQRVLRMHHGHLEAIS
jgi:putative ABC transport system ATP-binding protein